MRLAYLLKRVGFIAVILLVVSFVVFAVTRILPGNAAQMILGEFALPEQLEALLSAVPVPEPGLEARSVRLEGPLPSPKDPPPGCCFTTRCPRRLGPECDARRPPLVEAGAGHRLACHIPLPDLAAAPPIWRAARRLYRSRLPNSENTRSQTRSADALS